MGILFLIIGVVLLIWLLQLPGAIAEYRGIKDPELTTINILGWFGVLLGVTWFIALALSLIYQPKKWVDGTATAEKTSSEGMDLLLKLKDLQEKGVITQEELEKQKEKILPLL